MNHGKKPHAASEVFLGKKKSPLKRVFRVLLQMLAGAGSANGLGWQLVVNRERYHRPLMLGQ